VSGIQRGHLVKGVSFAQVQTEVGHLIQNKIVVGHALHNDFRVLKLSHPFRLVRDTSKYKPFRTLVGSYGAPTLKLLAERILGIRIQTGEHNPITDAKTALRLYMLHKKKWEVEIKKNKPRRYK
jgi:RNA exonuclease 4